MNDTLMGGLIGGTIGVVLGWVIRHMHILLLMFVIYKVYHWITTDPVVERHQIELQQEERQRVQDQHDKVIASSVVLDTRESEATAIITNNSSVRVSDIALFCKYRRPSEEDPWRITSPVAMTGVLAPGQSQRITFDMRDMASDAMTTGLACTPKVTLNPADLLKTKIVKPKHGRDEMVASSDVQVSGRMGAKKADYASIVVEGTITNNSSMTITKITTVCSAIMNASGRTENFYGGTSIYVAPGETKSFGFQTPKSHIMDERIGFKDISCRLLNLDNS